MAYNGIILKVVKIILNLWCSYIQIWLVNIMIFLNRTFKSGL